MGEERLKTDKEMMRIELEARKSQIDNLNTLARNLSISLDRLILKLEKAEEKLAGIETLVNSIPEESMSDAPGLLEKINQIKKEVLSK